MASTYEPATTLPRQRCLLVRNSHTCVTLWGQTRRCDESVPTLGRMCRGRRNGDAVPRLGWRLRLVAGERVRALARFFYVDARLRVPEEAAVPASSGGKDLAQDRQGRFGRAIRPDVATRSSGDALEL